MTKLIDPSRTGMAVAALFVVAVGALPSSAFAGKEIFVRSKPHVNVAPTGPSAGITAEPRTAARKKKRRK